MRLSVCLSVAMVPTLHHLQSGAAQTMTSSRMKFAQFVEDELRHLHVEKRGNWGAWWTLGTNWKSANLRHGVYVLKSRRENGENAKKRSARVDSRAHISATKGPIDMGGTRMRREMQGLAYVVSLDERHVTRAVLMAPSVKTCGFWTFFTIQVGAQEVIDFRRRDKRSFAEECTGFRIHRKHMLSFGHTTL